MNRVESEARRRTARPVANRGETCLVCPLAGPEMHIGAAAIYATGDVGVLGARRGRATICREWLVVEQAHAGVRHGDAVFAAGFNDLRVAG